MNAIRRDPAARTAAPSLSSPTAPSAPSADRIIDRIARDQHGVVSRAQLLAEGVTRAVIDHRVAKRRLRPLHRGVYVAGPVTPPLASEMAACLACGTAAFVSHESAGGLWGIRAESRRGRNVDIVLRRGYRRRPGVRVHRITTLREDETTVLRGIPITTPSRTVYDLAARLKPAALERAAGQAVARGLATAEEMLVLARRHAGRRGAHRLRAILGGGGPAFTRSRAEEMFLELVRRSKAPPPLVNQTVCGHEVDFYWPDARLVVEIDGRAFHSSSRDFERDRHRDAELSTRGIRVMRLTWRKLTGEPDAILFSLGGALAAAPPAPPLPAPVGRSGGR